MTTRRLGYSAALLAAIASLSTGCASRPEKTRSTTTRPTATRPATSRAVVPKPVKKVAPPPAVSLRNGRLSYVVGANGDRVPDFSFAGYAAGEKPIPTVPAKLLAGAPADDNDATIAAAINQAGRLPIDANGFRGAVLIPPGTYELRRPIVLDRSGVVLRGSGTGENGTTLLAAGTDRRTVIEIKGAPRKPIDAGHSIIDAYVPVNATTIHVEAGHEFKAGESVAITRPSTPDWIAAVGMDDLGGDRHGPSWRPNSREIVFDRTITKVDSNAITLDAPLTIALDADFGGATIAKADWPGRVTNVGVENLRVVSTFDAKNPKDEEHAWFGVGITNARDVWVRQVSFSHLAGSAVAAWETSSRVTIEDCKNLAPVGEIGGLRRNAFFTNGQQVLMQRLFSEDGVHDFAVGFAAAGPNAFVQCESKNSLGESGPIDSAACGSLFDRVRIDGQPLSLRNRTYQGQGVGWASFNGVMWNSTAPLIACEKPPMAQNWAFGTNGEFTGNGVWNASNDDVNPDSLYYAQLADRIGRNEAEKRAQLNLPPVQGSRAATIEDTARIIEISKRPRVDMAAWADQAAARNPIPTSSDGVARAAPPVKIWRERAAPLAITIDNGWLLIDGRVAVGGKMQSPWWNGGVRPSDLDKAQPALTRFVPGRHGNGLTDEIYDVVATMQKQGSVAFFQFPPLWYERRRDDHERVQRIDGDVVAPFYETPWARSGVGRASDGLSKFDVTKPNTWYYARLNQFADLAAPHGMLLFNGMYQQHSVLEAGAHYADAPWRTANNVNPVGIPEPVFFAGDKLIYVAEQFYDVSDPGRRALHRTYIRNTLDALADKPNVVFYLSEEYTGPLAFTQFWLDTIAQWKADTGKSPLIALYATKDVTDAILNDEKRSAVVSIIYNSFDGGDAAWWYQPDGKLYAPEGGKNLSPRQWMRLLKPKSADFEGVYKAVAENRAKYPDKPFVYTGDTKLAWAVLMGGGSMADLKLDPRLAAAIAKMRPERLPPGDTHLLVEPGGAQYLMLTTESNGDFNLKSIAEFFDTFRIDPRTGQIVDLNAKINGPTIIWARRK